MLLKPGTFADMLIVIQTSLTKEEAWEILPLATRQRLYGLLPPAPEGRPHNFDVHPCKTLYKDNITKEIKAWQEDLKEGKETKKWREEALQAGHDRSQGLWDDWKEAHREETWGPRQDENEEINEDAPEINESENGNDAPEHNENESGKDVIMS